MSSQQLKHITTCFLKLHLKYATIYSMFVAYNTITMTPSLSAYSYTRTIRISIGMTHNFKFPCSLVPSSYSDTPENVSYEMRSILIVYVVLHFIITTIQPGVNNFSNTFIITQQVEGKSQHQQTNKRTKHAKKKNAQSTSYVCQS